MPKATCISCGRRRSPIDVKERRALCATCRRKRPRQPGNNRRKPAAQMASDSRDRDCHGDTALQLVNAAAARMETKSDDDSCRDRHYEELAGDSKRSRPQNGPGHDGGEGHDGFEALLAADSCMHMTVQDSVTQNDAPLSPASSTRAGRSKFLTLPVLVSIFLTIIVQMILTCWRVTTNTVQNPGV